jgi:membrane-bound inhibitor of C-type lysozyme
MKILPLPYLMALLIPALAMARGETVSFPGTAVANKQVRSYLCDGNKRLGVLYINTTDGDSFAYLPVDGTQHVFVTVMSGSGAKYASGPYVWWTKGPQGNLTREDDTDAPPLLANCVEQPPAPGHSHAGNPM